MSWPGPSGAAEASGSAPLVLPPPPAGLGPPTPTAAGAVSAPCSETFPNPEAFLTELLEKGIRVSLWQLPCVAKGTVHYGTARARGFIPSKSERQELGSNLSAVEFDGTIDFTNPEATAWYQGLLERLLRMGASVIKTDFGEEIEENAEYRGAPYRLLHNLYPLLYQRSTRWSVLGVPLLCESSP
jgi:alpha-glucosidase (family GH31 glycosyl hydrolase)